MNSSPLLDPLFNALFNALWYLIPILLIAFYFKSSSFKGLFGEVLVNALIKRRLDKNTYHLIKDVTLPTEDGTTQIDHILVSEYGVFAIETKNMKGWIFGSEKQKQWTQRIFKYSTKFQNPIHQNYKHLKTLESCLDIPADHFFSVIVFTGDSTFKTQVPDNVTDARGCIKYIKSKKDKLLSHQQVKQLVAVIEKGRLKPSFKTDRRHVKHVKKIVRDKDDAKACPECGSKMILREAKRGANMGNKFYGCSTFPRCRATAKI